MITLHLLPLLLAFTAKSLSEKQSEMKFPSEHLLPKIETTAASFLKANPDYDGTGVTIGILDTGVDPGAIGLGSLPNGRGRKVIHVADCTGAGDVDMSMESTAVFVEGKGWVIEKGGLFGKEIVLNPKLRLKPFPSTNGNGDVPTLVQETTVKTEREDDEDSEDEEEDNSYDNLNYHDSVNGATAPVRLGYKRAYDLFPKKLMSRVQDHHKKIFDEQQSHHAFAVRTQLSSWEQKFAKKKPTVEEQREKEDLQARLQILEGLKLPSEDDPLKEDPGPLYQVILFYDGKDYRVIVDTELDGDLSLLGEEKAMTDFHKEGQYGTFSHVDMCNYSINVYKEGLIVSIVMDCSPHGSHVAGIAAAFFPRNTDTKEEDSEDYEAYNENNSDVGDTSGVAPGAKIVSLKVGDARLGSMETGSSLVRALIEAVKHKCDVINLSYGEASALPNRGRFIELAEEVVQKYGIVFMASAGNNGPCLSSVGAPGGTSDALIGVAAFVSKAMMEVEYSMRVKNKALDEMTTFTWSSVGPTADGSTGVDIAAPGAAITCVPNWCLQRNQLMNGTSMSSPNAAGCVALLLSAAKAEGIKVTPARLKRAIMNSAKEIDGLTCLQQGSGMIQVEKAWEYLKNAKDDVNEDINYKVNVLDRPGQPRGVYLRQPQEVTVQQTFTVNVNALFATVDDVDLETQKKRVEFEMKFSLKSTAHWVDAPDFFMLMHNGRSFKFSIDPTKLDPGVHTARILAYDSSNPEAGPRFVVPITVLKPLQEALSLSFGKLEFEPSETKRNFLTVPKGATWMDVSIKDCRDTKMDKDLSSRLLVLATVQLLENMSYRDAEEKKYFNLFPGRETVTSIPVHPGVTCELALASYWSAVGTTSVKVNLNFRGVTVTPSSFNMLSGGGGVRALLSSNLREEYINPSAKFTKWKSPLSPVSEGLISPCDERDILPTRNKQIYQLLLTYEFEQKEAGAVIPRAPALQGYLYESGFESQMMQIFDEDKKFLGVADSYPDEVNVPKGKICIRLQIRHDDVKKLEKLKDLSIWIERKLSKEIALSAYTNHNEMVIGGNKFKRRALHRGTSLSVFLKEPPTSDLPTACKCGDIIIGSATFVDGGKSLPGSGKEPGGFPLQYVVGKKMEKKDEKHSVTKTPELPDDRSPKERMSEAVRSLKVKELMKFSEKTEDAEKFEELFDEILLKEYPDYIPLLIAGLKHYDNKDRRKKCLAKIIDLADSIIGLVDESDLALHFGTTHDEEDPKSCKQRKDMEEKKGFLIEALARKAHAVGDVYPETNRVGVTFDDTLKSLSKWETVDSSNKKLAFLILRKHEKAKRYGSALQLLNELLKSNGSDTNGGMYPLSKVDILERRTELLKKLNYTHLVARNEKWKAISSPKNYSLF